MRKDADQELERAAKRRQEFCHEVYATTATKKVSDLTVIEAQAVRACQEAGYYH
jgi:hypothetical protein